MPKFDRSRRKGYACLTRGGKAVTETCPGSYNPPILPGLSGRGQGLCPAGPLSAEQRAVDEAKVVGVVVFLDPVVRGREEPAGLDGLLLL